MPKELLQFLENRTLETRKDQGSFPSNANVIRYLTKTIEREGSTYRRGKQSKFDVSRLVNTVIVVPARYGDILRLSKLAGRKVDVLLASTTPAYV